MSVISNSFALPAYYPSSPFPFVVSFLPLPFPPHSLSSFLACSTLGDVARVEAQTFMCSDKREDTIPTTKEGITSTLGHWKAPEEMDKEQTKKFTGSMKGTCLVYVCYVLFILIIIWLCTSLNTCHLTMWHSCICIVWSL